MLIRFLSLFVLFFIATNISAEEDSSPLIKRLNHNTSPSQSALFKKYSPNDHKQTQYKRWKGLKYSGYVRSYIQYRILSDPYPDAGGINPLSKHLLTVNGLDIQNLNYTGYQEPMFLLRLEGTPTSRTSFKVEYMFDNQMVGKIREDSTLGQRGIASNLNRRSMTYRIFQFTGSASTKFGDFNLICGGGVNWYRMSPFTLWNYEYRDDMFERYPWDPDQKAWNKYTVFYATQNIARDSRWGNTGTQGFIIEGKNLPAGFGFSFLYGKTDNSGGFQTYLTKIPKNMLSGRIKKSIKGQEVAINYFSQFGYPSPVALERIRQQIITGETKINLDNKLKIYSEVGLGQFQDGVIDKKTYQFLYDKTTDKDSILPTGLDFGWHKNTWQQNRALHFQVDFTKDLFNVPLSVQMFSIGKGVVNINSQVLNSANPHAIGTPANIGTAYDITTLQGAITDIGQMTNNRQGINIKHEDTYGALKLMLALGMNQEIENDTANNTNQISYWHHGSSFPRSRFVYFQSMTGPYGRISSIFRRTYEKFTITDTLVDYKKSYNIFDAGLKYKTNLLRREIIFALYYNHNSVRDKLSPLPSFKTDNSTFIVTDFVEFSSFYALHPKVTLLGFVSIEWLKGNKRMNLADSAGNQVLTGYIENAGLKTLNQQGHGYGIGIDYDFANRASLNIRHRWFDHKDKNFVRDLFRGQESTVELKIFF